jgi:hypothetical protein
VVEQRPFKPKVVGSIPTAPTNIFYTPVRPGMIVLDVSVKSGGGMEQFLDFLRSRRGAARIVAASQGAKAFAAPD